MSFPPRSAFLRTCVALVASAGIMAGCGINMDRSPREVDAQLSTTTTTTDRSRGGEEAILYYVAEGSLVPSTAMLSDRSADTLIQALLKPPPQRLRDVGVFSAIPSGTTVLDSRLTGTSLVVNLSSAFDNVVGVSRQQAIAQIVLTVTQQAVVRTVEFRVNGERIQVTSPSRGDRAQVTNCDFKDLLATPDQAKSLGLGDASIDLLSNRSARLNMIC